MTDLPPSDNLFHFPQGFLWGVASSPSQVEAGLDTDWTDTFKRIGARTPDHLGHFKTDLEIIVKLGLNAYRFGIDWSRLQKGPSGPFLPASVATYRHMMHDLREKGLTTVVTLHHFANPAWLPGGSLKNRENVRLFCDFVVRAVQEFGDLVDYWNVINEPDVYVLNRYMIGVFPPFKKWAVVSAYRELANLREVVRRCWDLLKERDQKVISIAKNFRHFSPAGGTLVEKGVSRLLNVTYNDWIFENFFLPGGKPVTDLIGINFYGPTRFKGAKPFIPGVFPKAELEAKGTFDDMQELGASWLEHALHYVKDRTDLPIVILENGVGSNDDSLRQRILRETIQHLAMAMSKGIDVRGYFHWSLLDNIEWIFGNSIRYGLVQVDPHTSMERTVKGSATIYSRIAKENSIEMPS